MRPSASPSSSLASVAANPDAEIKANTAFIDGIRQMAMDVRELSIDLIDRVNPFGSAYAILAKSMNEERFQQVAAAIARRNSKLTPEEAKDLAQRAARFKKENGRLSSCQIANLGLRRFHFHARWTSRWQHGGSRRRARIGYISSRIVEAACGSARATLSSVSISAAASRFIFPSRGEFSTDDRHGSVR